MKYVFTIESPTLLSEKDCDLLQKEFHDAMIKHFKEGMFDEGIIRNMRKEKQQSSHRYKVWEY